MRFSTVFSVLAVSAVALAGAAPNGNVPNGNGNGNSNDNGNGNDPNGNGNVSVSNGATNGTDIKSVFDGFIDDIAPPLAKLNGCGDGDCVKNAIDDICGALQKCNATVAPLPQGPGDNDDAASVVKFAQEIANGLTQNQESCGSKCSGSNDSYPKLDGLLSNCVGAALSRFPDLPSLIDSQTGDLKPVLEKLGLNATFGTLGAN